MIIKNCENCVFYDQKNDTAGTGICLEGIKITEVSFNDSCDEWLGMVDNECII